MVETCHKPPATKEPMQLAESHAQMGVGTLWKYIPGAPGWMQCGRSQCDRVGKEFLLMVWCSGRSAGKWVLPSVVDVVPSGNGRERCVEAVCVGPCSLSN